MSAPAALSPDDHGFAAGRSIFPSKALSRGEVRWEDYLHVLTPVEERNGLLYKREDYFAPLGYGGVNGMKLRQLIWLVEAYVRMGGDAGLLTGASILSPQLSMATLVARHYGLPTRLVLGGTKPDTCLRAENVAIAVGAGAVLSFIPVGYNPSIQKEVARLYSTELEDWYRLCYGITTPGEADDAEVAAFHRVGSWQVSNLPPGVRTIVMTAGSCNSCVSVLAGIAAHPEVCGALERVVLVGIGPTRLQWIEDRLAAIEHAHPDLEITNLFRRLYHDHSGLEAEHQTDGRIVLEHHDLHARGVYRYGDRAPWTQDGIDFHPTYEGKMLNYFYANAGKGGDGSRTGFLRDGSVLVWIVGSAPSRKAMSEAFLLAGIRA